MPATSQAVKRTISAETLTGSVVGKHPAWFNAEAIKPSNGHRFVYCRKGNTPGQVIVFQRHFINIITAEEAKQQYVITNRVADDRQSNTECDFQWFLNY